MTGCLSIVLAGSSTATGGMLGGGPPPTTNTKTSIFRLVSGSARFVDFEANTSTLPSALSAGSVLC